MTPYTDLRARLAPLAAAACDEWLTGEQCSDLLSAFLAAYPAIDALLARGEADREDAVRLANAAGRHGTCSTCQEALRLHDHALALEDDDPPYACEDCGWEWPTTGTPPDGAECDSCGGAMWEGYR